MIKNTNHPPTITSLDRFPVTGRLQLPGQRILLLQPTLPVLQRLLHAPVMRGVEDAEI